MFKAKEIVTIALFTVLIAVCSWISIPTAIPFTMQTFGVFLALNCLGPKKGTLSVFLYLLMGALGLPVFANGTAGVGVILGTTGGYMIGWIFSGLVIGFLRKVIGVKPWAQAFSLLAGLFVCYGFGTAWFWIVYTKTTGFVSLWTALVWCVFPFLIPDLIKLGLVLIVTRRLKKIENLL